MGHIHYLVCLHPSSVKLTSCRLVVQRVKSLPATQKTQVPSLGREDPLEKDMATHPVFLPGESHGQRSLVGYSPWGSKESDTTTDTSYHYNMPVCHKTGILKTPMELRLAVLKRQASYWQSVNKNWMRKEWRWRTRTTPGSESSIHQVGINTEDDIDRWLGYTAQLTLRERQRLINVGTFQENKAGLPYWIPASPVAQLVNNLSPVQETQGWEDPQRKEQQPTPIFLPGESHGRRSLVGYSPWGHKESDTTEQRTLSLLNAVCSFRGKICQ